MARFRCCRLFAPLLFLLCLAAQAQQPPAGSNWARVQALPIGTSMHVSTAFHTSLCNLQAVDVDTLTCTGKFGSKPTVLQRANITVIKLTRRAASTAVGAGIGAGAGALIGMGISGSLGGFETRKVKAAGAGAAVFIIPGIVVGYFSDMARGPVVYRTP
jgi:hypothetical protein